MVRNNQIQGLLDASRHTLIAGFIVNFRNANNDTFFISIDKFIRMTESLNKKSFNIKDLMAHNALRIQSTKKRTRYTYDIQKMIQDLKIGVENGN